jgi:prepilin-type processing-associated H-X9-DG protein
VAILTSLLTAALNQTRSNAHQITCLNNLRQLQISWLLYVDDNQEELPLNRTDAAETNVRLLGMRNSADSWVVGSPKEDLTPLNLMRGSLYPYVKAVSPYRCPSDPSKVVGHPEVRRTRSYSMSDYMNGDRAGIDPRVKTRHSEINGPSPDDVFVFIEEHEESIWAGSFAVAPKGDVALNSPAWVSTPADRHREGGNISFADGHVEFWRWYSSQKFPSNKKSGASVQKVWDLKRLQQAIPHLPR